jgi:hypothetical protein
MLKPPALIQTAVSGTKMAQIQSMRLKKDMVMAGCRSGLVSLCCLKMTLEEIYNKEWFRHYKDPDYWLLCVMACR